FRRVSPERLAGVPAGDGSAAAVLSEAGWSAARGPSKPSSTTPARNVNLPAIAAYTRFDRSLRLWIRSPKFPPLSVVVSTTPAWTSTAAPISAGVQPLLGWDLGGRCALGAAWRGQEPPGNQPRHRRGPERAARLLRHPSQSDHLARGSAASRLAQSPLKTLVFPPGARRGGYREAAPQHWTGATFSPAVPVTFL